MTSCPVQTVDRSFVGEFEEKNSRFIAELLPYADLGSALKGARRQHPKACHHVTAYRYFDENDCLIQKGKDDGEPSGTAGIPALRALEGKNLVNVAVIITRYFGGVKLGTGGLARAYAASANAAIKEAEFLPFEREKILSLSADFSRSGGLEQLCAKARVEIVDRAFDADGVVISLKGPEEAIIQLEADWAKQDY